MSGSLRILTYNTQLRSWMMEVGWPPSIPPVYSAPERAANLVRKLLSSSRDYDIVCLNEVFDEEARDILSSGLRNAYPYQVAKADLLSSRIVEPNLAREVSNKLFDLTFGPVLDLAGLFALKFEDSGLFLASRFPFEYVGVPPAVVDALGGDAGVLFPLGVPVISFRTYSYDGECAGGDCRASKGILHARLRVSGTLGLDLFMTHTQADDESVDQHRPERDAQMAAAWEFIRDRAGGPPFPRATLMLGDMNIVAGAAENVDQPAEWQALFNTPGSPFTDELHDLWGAVQCRGGGSGLDDPGITATVRYEPIEERLDIMAAALGPGLVAQHVSVDYEIAAPPPPSSGGPSYQSDHRPLGVDLAEPHPNASPVDARRVADVMFADPGFLAPGQVRWYRYDIQGTYEFSLRSADPAVYDEIYLGSDLSRPRRPFRNESHPDFGTRFVLVAPFFVKVANHDRRREFAFDFRSHRHEGRDPFDWIDLITGVPHPESFPDLQQLNGDNGFIPWDDTDTKWFRLTVPKVDLDRVHVGVRLTHGGGDVRLSLLAAFINDGGPPDIVGSTGADAVDAGLEWDARPGDRFYVCVQRQDPGFRGVGFSLLADMDVTLLIGGQEGMPTLTCTDETSGWGADDIRLELSNGAGFSIRIPNDEIGDFEQDTVRDLGQWLAAPIAYRDGLAITVVEEDDIGHDDIGHATIPRFADIAGWDRWVKGHPRSDGAISGGVRIDVDDGTYTLGCLLTRWDETL